MANKLKENDAYKDQRERAKAILAYITKRKADSEYKATEDEEKLIYKPNNNE